MALSVQFSRIAVTTTTETSSQEEATHEADGSYYFDVTATVNTNLRLLHRFKLTPVESGQNQNFIVRYLDFSSTADQTFTAGQITTPFTDAEADSITVVGNSPLINMDALYTLAGDTEGV